MRDVQHLDVHKQNQRVELEVYRKVKEHKNSLVLATFMAKIRNALLEVRPFAPDVPVDGSDCDPSVRKFEKVEIFIPMENAFIFCF